MKLEHTKNKEGTSKSPLSKANLLLVALGILCVFFIATDANAWGVPGRAAPGSGQGPGGGARSGSAPAPFSFLYLSFAVSMGSILHSKIAARMSTSIWLALLVGLSGALGLVYSQTAFLLTIPLIGIHLGCRRNLKSFNNTEWLIVSIALFVIPFYLNNVAPLLAASLVVYYLVMNKNISWQTKVNGCLCVMFALCLWQPISNGINPWLQGQMAKLTTVVLSAIGYNVQVVGNVVYGLTTTVHVSKACVGTEVFATSFVLCAFLSTLFIKPGNQLHTSIRLFGLIFTLNVIRLAAIILLGHHLADWSFTAMHDALGWLIASLTYGLIALILYFSPHRQSLPMSEGNHA